jgi:predicted enzyme related to lactoylglutathione lyase
MDNMIVWADIPVTDLDRARKFYAAVLQREFITIEGMEGVALPAPDDPNAPPSDDMPVAFDLALGDDQKPSMEGCTVYLASGGDATGMLQRAADAGGEILMPATYMGEMVGTLGFFRDSEGNRIGVHQQGPV